MRLSKLAEAFSLMPLFIETGWPGRNACYQWPVSHTTSAHRRASFCMRAHASVSSVSQICPWPRVRSSVTYEACISDIPFLFLSSLLYVREIYVFLFKCTFNACTCVYPRVPLGFLLTFSTCKYVRVCLICYYIGVMCEIKIETERKREETDKECARDRERLKVLRAHKLGENHPRLHDTTVSVRLPSQNYSRHSESTRMRTLRTSTAQPSNTLPPFSIAFLPLCTIFPFFPLYSTILYSFIIFSITYHEMFKLFYPISLLIVKIYLKASYINLFFSLIVRMKYPPTRHLFIYNAHTRGDVKNLKNLSA